MYGFSMRGYGGYGGYGGFDDGPDRRNWKTKSDAALRREQTAMELFDAFLENSKSSPTFPVTQDVVPAAVHLTDPCWKAFKKYAIAGGCTTKRREATHVERIASKDSRKGKLYVISVTVPVNPSQLQEEVRKKEERAAAAAEKKRADADRKAAQERDLQAKIQEEYASVVASCEKPKVLGDHNPTDTDNAEGEPSPSKKRKVAAITVPRQKITQHADQIHNARLCAIAKEIRIEKNKERTKLLSELDTKMEAKEAALKQEAQAYRGRVQQCIVDLTGGAQ